MGSSFIYARVVVKRALPPLSTPRVGRWGDRQRERQSLKNPIPSSFCHRFPSAAAAVILSACHVGWPPNAFAPTERIKKKKKKNKSNAEERRRRNGRVICGRVVRSFNTGVGFPPIVADWPVGESGHGVGVGSD